MAKVFEFPPKLLAKIDVNLDSRYDGVTFLFPPACCCSFSITFDSVLKLELIHCVSFNKTPCTVENEGRTRVRYYNVYGLQHKQQLLARKTNTYTNVVCSAAR